MMQAKCKHCGASHKALKGQQQQEHYAAKGLWRNPSATAVEKVEAAAAEAYVRSGGAAQVWAVVFRTDVSRNAIRTFGKRCI